MRLRPILALLLLDACAGLKLQVVNTASRKPSNVAVLFTVDKRNGDPVPGLAAEDFRIYEDGAPVSQLESKQTIVNPQVAGAYYTLLLVDLSGSVTGSGELPQLQAASQSFAKRVSPLQRVGIYAFDGSPTLTPIAPFSASDANAGIERLGSIKMRDPSTNLHGAVVEALRVLRQALDKATQPLKFGTLVVFTDGTDHAHRVTEDAMMEAVDDSDVAVFTIGVGAEIDPHELRRLGRNGSAIEHDSAALQASFDRIAARVEGYTRRFYLLSYCTPARAGVREVRIEAVSGEGAHGSVSQSFTADGFGPGCDPKTPPPFDPTLGGARKRR
jgi:hypothetical protein